MKEVSKDSVEQMAVEVVRREKKADRVDVASVEERDGTWKVYGTCPIDLEGHPWTERFEVIIDNKGKVISTYFCLL